jgi:hypothetical protein
MHIFHRWSKWEEYLEEGVTYGVMWCVIPEGVKYTKEMQKRHCEICGKVQREPVGR